MEAPEHPKSTIPGEARSNRFPKRHRLSGHLAPDRLFSLGQSFGHYPFRFVYYNAPLCPSPQGEEDKGSGVAEVAFLISVPKRQVKLASGRNFLKRQMREVLRQNFRTVLLPHLPLGTRWHIAVMFTGGKNKFSFPELEKKLISGLKRLADKASAPTSPKQP